MRDDATELELRARFRRLRDEEGRGAPAFDPLLRAAQRKKAPRRRPLRVWLPVAGALAAAAALLLALRVVPPKPAQNSLDLEAWSALSQWTAPTDTFLQSSGPSWDSTKVTTPSDSWMDTSYGTDEAQSTKKETL